MDITQLFTNFENQWYENGRVDFDHEYGYQCVDLARQYWYQIFGLGNSAGGVANATDYWHNTPSGILAKFSRVGTTNVLVGDVVVLSINHIGIANGKQTDTTYQQLDQNGGSLHNGDGIGGDAIQTHTFNKSDILGVLRPIGVSYGPSFTVSVAAFSGQFTVNPGMHKWNLGLANFDTIDNNPVAYTPPNPIIFQAVLVRSDIPQYQYYLEDPNVHEGYNTLDVTPYVPAPVPAPAPSVPSLSATSAAPMPVNYATTPIQLVVKVPGYMAISAAVNHSGSAIPLDQGNYLQFEVDSATGMLHIAKSTTSMKYWINPADNVKPQVVVIPPPTPAVVEAPAAVAHVENEGDVRSSLKTFFPDGSPISCKVLQTFLMTDRLKSGEHITVNKVDKFSKANIVHVYGTFEQGGKPYALLRVKDDPNGPAVNGGMPYFMYGAPIAFALPGYNLTPYLKEQDPLLDRLKYYREAVYDKTIGPIIDGVFRPKKTKK